jgi:hypothetical protein
VRVAVRQIRDLVGRLIWRLELPSGFDASATSLVVESEVRWRNGLEELDRLVSAGTRVDPASVAVTEPRPGVFAIDAAGEPSLFVAPLAMDLARGTVAHGGPVEVHAVDVAAPALAGALDGAGARVEVLPDGFRLTAAAAAVPPAARPELEDLLERGLEVPDELWERLFALSLDVLLNVDRRPDPEEDPE